MRRGWLKRIHVELREAGVFAVLLLPLLPVLLLGAVLYWWIDSLLWVTVTCPDCKGTGICQQPRPVDVHSCCGDCNRIEAPPELKARGVPLIGDGRIVVRPWEAFMIGYRRRAVAKPPR